jgi:small subunit ribosomal protein S17
MPRKKTDETAVEENGAEATEETPATEETEAAVEAVEAGDAESGEAENTEATEDKPKKSKKAKSEDASEEAGEETSILDAVIGTVASAVETVASTVTSAVSNLVSGSDDKKADTGRGNRSERIGMVTSDKMTKTVVVRVDRLVKHPKYRKYVRRKKQFMAHDELGATIGDKVRIIETRPLSARKRWRVVEIVQKAAK